MSTPSAAGPRGYRDQVGAHPSPWEGIVPALDVFLHDLGLGIFLVATVGWLVSPARFADLARIGWPVAFGIVGVDMLLLLWDLGDWTRFFHMFRVFKPGTPMSLGVWSLSAFLGALTLPALWGALATVGLAPGETPLAVRALALLALPLAVPAAIYKGAVFSITSQPGWRDARWTSAAFGVSAVLLGATALLPVAAASGFPSAGALWRMIPPLLLLDIAVQAAWEVELRHRRGRALPWVARIAAMLLALLAPPTLPATLAVAALVHLPAILARLAFFERPSREPGMISPP
jgi:hypothetical protein